MKSKYSTYIIVAISLFVAFMHFVTGPAYNGIYPHFVQGYLIDLLLPMNLYLLLQISLRKTVLVKQARIIGALLPFLFGVGVEYLQYSKIELFGRTYDPLDIVMYGIGVLLGFIIDIILIDRFENKH